MDLFYRLCPGRLVGVFRQGTLSLAPGHLDPVDGLRGRFYRRIVGLDGNEANRWDPVDRTAPQKNHIH